MAKSATQTNLAQMQGYYKKCWLNIDYANSTA